MYHAAVRLDTPAEYFIIKVFSPKTFVYNGFEIKTAIKAGSHRLAFLRVRWWVSSLGLTGYVVNTNESFGSLVPLKDKHLISFPR